MRGSLSSAMYRGRQKGNRNARNEKRIVRQMVANRKEVYGRRPGRVAEIDDKRKGHFPNLGELPYMNTCMIYFQNAGTLQPWGEEISGAFQILKAAKVDIIGVSEINKNWAHPAVKQKYERSIRQHYTKAQIKVASNGDYNQVGFIS